MAVACKEQIMLFKNGCATRMMVLVFLAAVRVSLRRIGYADVLVVRVAECGAVLVL
jgi:hypothetical protein